jgi:multidrug efflux system outer membrane protein
MSTLPRIAVAFMISFFLLVSGCAVHKARMPGASVVLPAKFAEAAGDSMPAPAPGRWWESFGDKTLNTLMDEAFQQNLDLSQAYYRLKELKAVVRIMDSLRSPSLNLDASAGRLRQPGFSGAETSDSYSLSAAAGYEIDLWKKLASSIRASRFDAMASYQDIKTLYISLSAQLADLYYLAVEQRAQLDLADRTIVSFQDTLDRVEQRYREGLVAALDVYQSRQNLAAAKAQRPVFESNLAVTLHTISVLLGRFPEKEIGGNTDSLPAVLPLSPGLPSELLAKRPDIESALLAVRASDERVAAAVADRFPSFNLTGALGGASTALSSLLNSPNIFWSLLLNAAQPILDGGRRKAEVERTEAVFQENLMQYHKTVLLAFQEVEDALARGRNSEERIAFLEDRESAASEALRLALDRYMHGLSDYLPVLTAQQLYYDAKSALLSARRQLISDRIQLARALGEEWTEDVIRTRLDSDMRKESTL